MKKIFFIKDKYDLIELLGEQDKNLKILEKSYNVRIIYYEKADGFVVEITGLAKNVQKVYSQLFTNTRVNSGLQIENAGSKISRKISNSVQEDISTKYLTSFNKDSVYATHNSTPIVPKTKNQKIYVDAIFNNKLVFAIGPAGTGKTFLAVAVGLAKLLNAEVSKIVLTRPVVESGEKLGFLPGDLYEKINPYLRPLYDAFYVMLGPEKFHKYRDDDIIEIVPLAYMRGRTLEDAFIILDEAQNTTPEQMKMFLTRMGLSSEIVVTGDITQIDLEKKNLSGLVLVEEILKGIKDIKFIYLTEQDVVRHQLVKKIIKAYEQWENKKNV